MVLDTSLLKTQQYKVRINGKVDQTKERCSTPPLYLGLVAIEKGAIEKVANFTLHRIIGGCYSFPWIAPLYSWFQPYNAEC